MARGDLLTSFSAWAAGRPWLEADVVDTIVDLKKNYIGDPQPGRWRSGDLSHVLLDLLPEKIKADDDWYACVVPTTREFLTYAGRAGRLHEASAPLPDLLEELDELEGEFQDAVHDESRFGMAKSLLGRVPQWGSEADDDNLEGPDHPEALPAVRLAPMTELAAAARGSGILAELERLVQWLGDGRPVGPPGSLSGEDLHGAAPALRRDRDGDDTLAPGRLRWLWELADALDVVVETEGQAHPGPARVALRALHESGPEADQRVLSLWGKVFEAMLDEGDHLAAPGEDPPGIDVLRYALNYAVISAYEGDPLSVPEIVDEMTELPGAADLADEDGVGGEEQLAENLDRWISTVAEELAAHGALQPVDQDPARARDLIELTPLGTYGVREYVVARGLQAPLARNVAMLPPEDVIVEIASASQDLGPVLAKEWFAARGTADGVREMLVAARSSAVLRLGALGVMAKALSEREFDEAVASVAEDPLLGPVTRAFVAERDAVTPALDALAAAVGPGVTVGDVFERRRPGPEALGDLPEAEAVRWVLDGLGWRLGDLPPHEQDLLIAESFARLMAAVEPPIRRDDLPPSYWEVVDEAAVLRLAATDHPELLDVLDAIGSGHPQGRVRKAAKKAAHKLRVGR